VRVALKHKFFYSSVFAPEELQRRSKADEAERQKILQLLKNALEEQPSDGLFEWQGYDLYLEEGSSLYEIHMPGRVIWHQLTQNSHVFAALRENRPMSSDMIRVADDGTIELYRDASVSWEKIEVNAHALTDVPRRLRELGDIAKQAGGFINATDVVDVEQWLRFHDLHLPIDAV